MISFQCIRQLFSVFACLFFIFSSHASTEICDGVIYENIRTANPDLSIHVAKIDPSKVSIILEAAHGKCNASEKVSEIAKRNNAIIAINGGFFDFGQKNKGLDFLIKLLICFGYDPSATFPIFGLKIRDRWFSLSNKNAGIIGWQDGGKTVCLDTTQMVWQLQIDENLYPIVDINKPYAPGPVLYTRAYDQVSPKKGYVTEVVVEDNKITKIVNGNGETEIPVNGFIYAIEKEYLDEIDFSSFTIGKSVSIVKKYSNEKYAWEAMDYLLGSTPLILKDGQFTETVLNSKSSFFVKNHPRTAIGILGDGCWVMCVVDGRQEHSWGMTLLELAQFMKELGCLRALNLDGGGSSIMVIENKIVNSPSGYEWSFSKNERSVSNAIVVLKK